MTLDHLLAQATRDARLRIREIWRYISVDLGLRVPVAGRLRAGVQTGSDTTYTLTVENGGIAGKGLTAEEVIVELMLPAGAAVRNTTGPGYQGVRRDSQSGAEVAVWQAPRLAPRDSMTYTITLGPPAAGAQRLRGAVRWSKPSLGDGSRDSVNVNLPQTP